MIHNFEFNSPKLVPNDSHWVILVGLILGLESNPLAVKTDSLSLPSGKDTQAGGPTCFFPLTFGSITSLFPSSMIQSLTATAETIISSSKMPKCPALFLMAHICYLTEAPKWFNEELVTVATAAWVCEHTQRHWTVHLKMGVLSGLWITFQ